MTKQTNKQTETNQTNTQQIPNFRHAYSPQKRVQITFNGPGRTKQEFKDESDINQIMARYMKTGLIDNVTNKLPQFSEVDGQTFQEAMQIVAESKSLFQELPSKIRTEFDNDPGKFLDFVHNPENAPRMAQMGLLRNGAQISTPPTNEAPKTQPEPVKQNLGSGLAEGQT